MKAFSSFQVLTSINLNSAIRVAAQWYQSHLGGAAQVLLITNDRENKRKAIEEGISAETSKNVLLWFWHLITSTNICIVLINIAIIMIMIIYHNYYGLSLLVNCCLVFSWVICEIIGSTWFAWPASPTFVRRCQHGGSWRFETVKEESHLYWGLLFEFAYLHHFWV